MAEKQQNLIEKLFEKGILLNKNLINQEVNSSLFEKIELEQDLIVLNDDYVDLIGQQNHLVDWYELDTYRVNAEIDRDDDLYQTQLQSFRRSQLHLSSPSFEQEQHLSSLEAGLNDLGVDSESETVNFQQNTDKSLESMETEDFIPSVQGAVMVIYSFENKPHKYTIHDFTQFFISRYKYLESLLRNRQELRMTLPITRILSKKEKEPVSIIGIVNKIESTRNDNLVLTLEDLTGEIRVIVPKNKKELFILCKDLVHDEVIGVSGAYGNNIIFAENIIWPDIPNNHELKKAPTEDYVLFLSDIHVGSTLFLREEFSKFISWINGKTGSPQQREIARNVKYIIIAGDLVDGVGIYPTQEEELEIKTIEGQYAEFCRLIKQIPLDKQIIICPGNHDVVHLAEPQSIFYKEFTAELPYLPNVTLVTNPALVSIAKTDSFPGFNILLYHGYSFDYYVANVESIRMGGGYHRADLIMKFLLKRRHLAPSFRSTPYYPGHQEDPLLIKTIPDFLITGHIHYSNVANYKGITMISGSCWQATTSFQEKLGHRPEPARVPVVNLKTREIKVLKFT